MANSNPYLILRRVRDQVILNLRRLFIPSNNLVVPNFRYKYLESPATGTIRFVSNPSNLNTIIVNGVIITFVTGIPSGNEVKIGVTQVITQANFIAFVNAHSSILLVTATQSPVNNVVNLTATVAGTAGNAITLVTNIPTVVQISGATLTQGGEWDFDNSEIFIGDVIPQDYQDWPMVVVDTASANETRYLGPEDMSWTKNAFGVVTEEAIFSSLVVTVNINLYTIDDTIARDEIIDLIYDHLSEIRDDLATHGIEMIDRTLPTEARVYQDGRWYITNHFILRVYCEWTDTLSDPNITGVSITVPVNTAPLPQITSPNFYNWDHTGGVPFSYQVTAINVDSTTVYSATGLPTGVSVNASNGLISGTPTQFGTFYVVLNVTNSTGASTGPLTLTTS